MVLYDWGSSLDYKIVVRPIKKGRFSNWRLIDQKETQNVYITPTIKLSRVQSLSQLSSNCVDQCTLYSVNSSCSQEWLSVIYLQNNAELVFQDLCSFCMEQWTCTGRVMHFLYCSNQRMRYSQASTCKVYDCKKQPRIKSSSERIGKTWH